jgi:hypothetical protein
MSYREPDFAAQIALVVKQYTSYANASAEMTAITNALGTEVTTHDVTIDTPAAALIPNLSSHTAFTNDILRIVNKGKGGNLSANQMISGISDAVGVAHAPAVIDVPFVSAVGALASCTLGNWTGSPSSYAYQWKRDGVTNIGTNASTYTMVVGDSGHTVGCVVSATNATGTGVAPLSNTVVGP